MSDTVPVPVHVVHPGAARILLRCLSYLRPYWRLTGSAYFALMNIAALALVIPQLIRRTVDLGIRGGDLAALRNSVALVAERSVLVPTMRIFWDGICLSRWANRCKHSSARCWACCDKW